jgi:transcriptional/translational regulatory protein YebC/TACO1
VKKSANVTEDALMNFVIDAGAEEINDLGENFEIVSDPSAMASVRKALDEAGIEYESADTPFLPTVSVPLDNEGASKVFKLIEAIEDCDDVQNVYANFDISDEVMATL